MRGFRIVTALLPDSRYDWYTLADKSDLPFVMFLPAYHGKRVVYETKRKGSFARVTCTRERTKLRACRSLLARRPSRVPPQAGIKPNSTSGAYVHPRLRHASEWTDRMAILRQRPGLLNGSVGHTEIVHRGCVSRGWFNTGMGNGDSYQPYTLCPAPPRRCFSDPPFPLSPRCRIVEFESLIILEIPLHLYLEHHERNSQCIFYFRCIFIELM